VLLVWLLAVSVKELDRRLQRIVQQPTNYQMQRFVQDMLSDFADKAYSFCIFIVWSHADSAVVLIFEYQKI